jgi:predicted nucleic acid-binding protein
MKLVVDANILFSFFKKDSTTRELILDPELKYDLDLFAPKCVLEEIEKHRNGICSKFSLFLKDFDIMSSSLPLFIKIVPRDLFKESLPMAEKILFPHLKDVPYVALSLSFKSKGYEIGLWSNEKRLKKLEKHGIKVFSTFELITFLSRTRI